ncbi:MAG: hypothetical protein GY797_02945 [Deltaproteobacteria bacterium]|nr:hypothetical protein [Deltaproteobacteria bacterium]
MAYDTEKYRSKREKVLGIKKRGMSFGVIAAIVSICIIVVLGFVVLPETIAYIAERNLDDAIYKVERSGQWSHEIMTGIHEIGGVVEAVTDKGGKRLIITFDRNEVDIVKFSSFFRKKGLKPTLLNRVNHRQRVTSLKEEEKLEAL